MILSKPQPNLNTRSGLTIKWLCKPRRPTPTHHTNSTSAISQLLLTRFWWNFIGRFLWTSRTDSNCHGDICPGNICPGDICPYQEYLSSYWPDLDETDSNCHSDICPGNISPYQEYLNCYWHDFDETLKVGSWEHQEQIPTVTGTFVQVTFIHIKNISAVTDPILMKL